MVEELSAEVPSEDKQYSEAFQIPVGEWKTPSSFRSATKYDHNIFNSQCFHSKNYPRRAQQ